MRIAREALKRKFGARGLRVMMESIMVDLMYDIPSHAITAQYDEGNDLGGGVTQKGQPLLVYQKTAETA